jgi:hypothetical protein
MSGIATAVVASSVISGAASKSAAGRQADAADRATEATERQYQQNREDMAPWRDAGKAALANMTPGLVPGGEYNRDFTLADFNADPGYQFRLDQGRDALEGSAAARGGLLSGGTLKALTNYGQQAGSQEYQSAYQRFNADRDRRFNRLASVAGVGQTATTDTARMGTDATNNMNATRMASADASASGIMGTANAVAGGVNGMMSLNMMNKFMPTTGVPAAGGTGTAYSGSPMSFTPIA